jgi:[acyl-carrier-protein] S-malonyltransferase/trans-AT polyketide synthase/acyltransferase/oxidoreductase domain-containing protein
VTSNYTGGFHSDSIEEVIRDLVFQISNPVQWKNNMSTLAKHSSSIYEIGPARPLREFFKTMQVNCFSVTTLSAAMRVFAGNN